MSLGDDIIGIPSSRQKTENLQGARELSKVVTLEKISEIREDHKLLAPVCNTD